MGKKDKEKKKGKGAAKTAEKTEKKQKTKIKKDLVAKGKESATGILLLSVLWIRNDLFYEFLEFRIIPMLFKHFWKLLLKKHYNQSKRRIYQLSSILYFTNSPTVSAQQSRIFSLENKK